MPNQYFLQVIANWVAEAYFVVAYGNIGYPADACRENDTYAP